MATDIDDRRISNYSNAVSIIIIICVHIIWVRKKKEKKARKLNQLQFSAPGSTLCMQFMFLIEGDTLEAECKSH